jgi:molybdopterin converting factor small subunit
LILPYCIVADPQVSAPASGVRQAAVEEIAHQDLRCFYSNFAQQPEAFTKEDALEFYATVEAFFDRVAVIPFRFPMLLESTEKLHEYLEEKSEAYASALHKLRDLVQMELRVTAATSTPASKPSGKQYMTTRLAQKQALNAVAVAARSVLEELSSDWRQRETREGLRCYALVARARIREFQERAQALAPGDEVRILVSGPWPATEFIE